MRTLLLNIYSHSSPSLSLLRKVVSKGTLFFFIWEGGSW